MLKQASTVLVFSMISISSFSITWCETGTEWKFHLYDINIDRIRTYTYTNDVLIDGHNAKQILRVDSGYDTGILYTYLENNVVYQRKGPNNWDTLYYYGEVGDKWYPLNTENSGCVHPVGMVTIMEVDSIHIGNELIGRWRLSYINTLGNNYSFYMFDRFGTLDLRIDPYNCSVVMEYYWTYFLHYTDPDITLTTWPTSSVSLQLKAFLDGPFDPVQNRMIDSLRTADLIPTAQPYAILDHWGMETLNDSLLSVEGDNAIVDWVLVELRAAADPFSIIQKRAFLIQRDGDIIDITRSNVLKFYAVPIGNYHITVRHRNHLGIMTASPVYLNANNTFLDFTLAATPTYGNDPRKVYPSVTTMWSGNSTADHMVRYTGSGNDRDPILLRIGGTVPTLTAAGYYPEDLNMDGRTRYTGTTNDRDLILQNIGGIIPTNTLYQQIP